MIENNGEEHVSNEIKNNKNCTINIINSIGQTDNLNPLEIYKNTDKDMIFDLEREFSERIGFSCNVLSSKTLPKELQNDFEISPRLVNNNLEYYTKPKTKDAYKKYPINMKFKLKFDNKDEANTFRKTGISDLQKKANITGKPVEIPNIVFMKEFIGDFEDPTSYINKNGVEGTKFYIIPAPIPKAKSYYIELFNNEYSFKIESTKLRIKQFLEKGFILDNSESDEEPYNVSIKIESEDIQKEDLIKSNFNINISLRDKFKDNSYYNLEIAKFIFIMRDVNGRIQMRSITDDISILNISHCGKTQYTSKDYNSFKQYNDILNKVLYIEKIENINIKYNYDYFCKNEDYINIIFYLMQRKDYRLKKLNQVSFIVEDDFTFDEQKHKNIDTKLLTINLFEKEFILNPHILMLRDCKLAGLDKIDNNNILKLNSNNIIIKPI